MSDELVFEEPELELTAIVSIYKGRPQLILSKKIIAPEKIRLLVRLILEDNYIPARIVVKDKLLFFANLKQKKLI